MSKAYEDPFHYDANLAKMYAAARNVIPAYLFLHPDTVEGLAEKVNKYMNAQHPSERITPPIITALDSFFSNGIGAVGTTKPMDNCPGKYDSKQIYADLNRCEDLKYKKEIMKLKGANIFERILFDIKNFRKMLP